MWYRGALAWVGTCMNDTMMFTTLTGCRSRRNCQNDDSVAKKKPWSLLNLIRLLFVMKRYKESSIKGLYMNFRGGCFRESKVLLREWQPAMGGDWWDWGDDRYVGDVAGLLVSSQSIISTGTLLLLQRVWTQQATTGWFSMKTWSILGRLRSCCTVNKEDRAQVRVSTMLRSASVARPTTDSQVMWSRSWQRWRWGCSAARGD